MSRTRAENDSGMLNSHNWLPRTIYPKCDEIHSCPPKDKKQRKKEIVAFHKKYPPSKSLNRPMKFSEIMED